MNQKFYLSKYIGASNIESYTLNNIEKLFESYKEYLKTTKGKDIEFPGFEIKMK
jgi:hypothetical protein